MSDNRKYYYLKLKENYFDDDSIVLPESMQDGVLYSNILLKLYLKSLKHGGRLQLDEDIPYTAQMIATITRQQIGTVERALQIFLKLGLVEVLDSGTFYMDSGGFKNASQDPSKSRCNKTKENDTEMSETDPFNSEEADGMSKRTQLEEYFSQSLEIDLLLRLCPDDKDIIYQIVDLLVDTCATNRKLLHIAGDDKPAEVVCSRFMKLNADHIRFVLKCFAENSSPIRNMKQYLLASLYNAPTTMQLSYQNQTNHDLANRR